jgi:hypothetical protein
LIFVFSFRNYYRYILTFRFLSPRPSASRGLIMASAVTLQMASRIAYGDNEVHQVDDRAQAQQSREMEAVNGSRKDRFHQGGIGGGAIEGSPTITITKSGKVQRIASITFDWLSKI